MRTNEEYENCKEILIEEYCNSDLTIEQILIKYNCTRSKFLNKMREWGIPRRPISVTRKKKRYNAIYNVDSTYFDTISTEHQAYWFGFLLADGFVNQKEISLCLQIKDIKMIENFRDDLKSSHPIKYNKDGNPFLTICCVDLSTALISKGLHHRKSWNVDIEQIISYIPENLTHHFIRGMFDGDGCIKYYSYEYLKKPQYHFGYTGVKNVCEFIKDFFDISPIHIP